MKGVSCPTEWEYNGWFPLIWKCARQQLETQLLSDWISSTGTHYYLESVSVAQSPLENKMCFFTCVFAPFKWKSGSASAASVCGSGLIEKVITGTYLLSHHKNKGALDQCIVQPVVPSTR